MAGDGMAAAGLGGLDSMRGYVRAIPVNDTDMAT